MHMPPEESLCTRTLLLGPAAEWGIQTATLRAGLQQIVALIPPFGFNRAGRPAARIKIVEVSRAAVWLARGSFLHDSLTCLLPGPARPSTIPSCIALVRFFSCLGVCPSRLQVSSKFVVVDFSSVALLVHI